MNHDEKMTGDSAMPAMDSMDHSKMADMEHGHIEPKPEATTSNEMTQHEPSEMMMATTKSAADNASQNGHWQIIPNFHPMVVHFPIALTLIAFLLSLAAYVRRNHPTSSQFAAAGHFTLWLAALGAATAVLFGWLAYNSVNHDDAGHVAMLLHRAWAVPTAIGLVLLASWDAWKHRVHELMSVPALILLFVLAETVAVTGWLGGEVVYRHGIGVLSLPASEGIGHSHHHEHAGTEANNHAHGAAEAEPGEHTEHHHDDEKGESHEH